jgi:hypothetical protein
MLVQIPDEAMKMKVGLLQEELKTGDALYDHNSKYVYYRRRV